jgi:hypothetical protein
MQSESVKVVVAASLLGGLLFCFVSCSMPQQDQAREDGLNQVKAEGAPSGMLFPSPEVVVSAATATLTPLSQTPTPPPTPTSTLAAMPIPTPESGPFAYHTISEGQTLGYIALIYGTEIDSLVKMNKLEGPSALIQIGQVLRVPVQTANIAPN